MKSPFTFTILRYVHDVFTSEFVNVGVFFYAPKARFLRLQCTSKLARITSSFPSADRDFILKSLRFLENRGAELANKIETELPFEKDVATIRARELAKTILPEDDSALQWSPEGSGFTEDAEATFNSIYHRMVEMYEKQDHRNRKEDKDVWTPFQKVFLKRGALSFLKAVEFKHGNYSQEFEHAWKNGAWQLYQPLSFDLLEKKTIVDKALHWSARINLLRKEDGSFKIYWLVGPPREPDHTDAFREAKSLLATEVSGPREVVEESEAEAFGEEMAKKITKS